MSRRASGADCARTALVIPSLLGAAHLSSRLNRGVMFIALLKGVEGSEQRTQALEGESNEHVDADADHVVGCLGVSLRNTHVYSLSLSSPFPPLPPSLSLTRARRPRHEMPWVSR